MSPCIMVTVGYLPHFTTMVPGKRIPTTSTHHISGQNNALSSITEQRYSRCLFQWPQTQLRFRLQPLFLNTSSFPEQGLFPCSSVSVSPSHHSCSGFYRVVGSWQDLCLLSFIWVCIPGDSLVQSKGACSLQTYMCKNIEDSSGRTRWLL